MSFITLSRSNALVLVHCISTGCGRTTHDTQAVAGFSGFGVQARPPNRSRRYLEPVLGQSGGDTSCHPRVMSSHIARPRCAPKRA